MAYSILFLSILLLSLSNITVLATGHHKHKHAHANAPSPSPSPSPAFDSAPSPSDSSNDVCSAYTTQLLECLDYIEEGSATATPGDDCCGGLRSMATGDVSCLCAMLGGSDDTMGFPINVSRVMTLPYSCKFALPTMSKCNALLGGTTVATAPVPLPSQGADYITSPPLPAQSHALALPFAFFTVAAGAVASMLSLIA